MIVERLIEHHLGFDFGQSMYLGRRWALPSGGISAQGLSMML
jgi:hypothetical protein